MKKILNKAGLAVILGLPVLLPAIAFAADDDTGIKKLLKDFGNILNLLLPITITIALLFFIWGLAIFIRDSGNIEKNAEGKNKMLWGIIALFVIVSIWGIVKFVGTSLGVEENATVDVPQLPGTRANTDSPAP